MNIPQFRNSRIVLAALVVLLMSASLFAATSIYDFTLPSIDGKPLPYPLLKER